jgi:5-methylcytosine-specific restriction endonuclease McrA
MSTDPEILRQLQKAREPKPPKAKKAIAKVSKKKQGQMILQKVLAELDKEFYLTVWHASAHVCQNCGCGLGNTPNNIFFHHLWEKRNYPQWRHRPENIMLLCLTCHSKAETNIDFAPEIKRRREQAETELLKQ